MTIDFITAEVAIDLVRAGHLLCFAMGMGIAFFFDFRTLQSMNVPIEPDDMEVLHEIHSWIMFAFLGLWVTGLTLVYVRTGSDLNNFTPKLYTKLAVMVLMTANAVAISRYVIPAMKKYTGRTILRIPFLQLVGITQCAINSAAFWIAGLVLGSSVFLKTSGWELLLPAMIGWLALCTIVGQGILTITLATSIWIPSLRENLEVRSAHSGSKVSRKAF